MSNAISSAPELWWLHLPPVTAPKGEVAVDFQNTGTTLGHIPNVMLALANAPEPFLAMRALYRSIMEDPDAILSRAERELIALVVSVENRCDLCVIGHSSVLRKLTQDPYNVGVIEVNYRRAKLSSRERVLADFAVSVTLSPAAIEPACLNRMRTVGMTEKEILEAAYVAAYYNMSNRLMSALGVKSQREAFFANREDRAPGLGSAHNEAPAPLDHARPTNA